MSRGYPSRKRVRKAFERGVKTARTGRGFNPYKNPILKDLYERGKNRTPRLTDAAAPPPPRSGNVAPRGGNAGLRSNAPQQRGNAPQGPRSGPPPQPRSNPFDPPRRPGGNRRQP